MEVRLSRDLLRFKRNRRLEEMEMELIRVEHNPSCKVKKKHRANEANDKYSIYSSGCRFCLVICLAC